MTIKLPSALKPIADFVIQVVIGAFGFAVIMCVAVALGLLVRGIEYLGFRPLWFTATAEWFEIGLFGLDLSLFSLFLLIEAIKLVRGLIEEVQRK
ncbi:hypothetical protein [uncultured Sphingomonas sp.]|uniref:hypothetical protein n=1 Tax=uncultured Sphingomonas sp. TaxID=158754 RepID=UPI0035CC3AF1